MRDYVEHPNPMAQIVYGRRLGPGDVLEATDVYASSNGRWERCPCPGLTLQAGSDPSVVWVRPE